jgi:predicted transcriptional regulator
MSPTTLQTQLLEVLRQHDGWMTRGELAMALNRSEGLDNDELLRLDELYRKGYIAKRIRPSSFSVYEYHFLPIQRTRMEVILNILREYYAGKWIRLTDIAYALGDDAGRLSRQDRQYLTELLSGGEIENQYDSVIGAMTYRVAG